MLQLLRLPKLCKIEDIRIARNSSLHLQSSNWTSQRSRRQYQRNSPSQKPRWKEVSDGRCWSRPQMTRMLIARFGEHGKPRVANEQCPKDILQDLRGLDRCSCTKGCMRSLEIVLSECRRRSRLLADSTRTRQIRYGGKPERHQYAKQILTVSPCYWYLLVQSLTSALLPALSHWRLA